MEANGVNDLMGITSNLYTEVTDAADFTAREYPANCGLLIVDLAVPKNVNAGVASGLLCAYCKPGFKATYDNNGVYATRCVAIDNCSTTNNTVVNAC